MSASTEPIFVAGNTKSLVKPVDDFNAPLKAAVEREEAKHLQENSYNYVERRINANE